MLQAQRLLETSDYSVDEVAGRCGFRSPVALRGHFRRQLGSSPAAYRAAYRARRPQGDKPVDSDGPVGPTGPAPSPPVQLHPDSGPVPIQSRRTPAPVGPPSENGRELYVGGRASLPGQRSGT